MKKIIFGITSLSIGGAERVLVDLCNKLCTKYDITIFTLYGNGTFEKELDKKIKRITIYDVEHDKVSALNRRKLSLMLSNNIGRKKLYDKYIGNKYDTEIAFLEGPMTWIFSIKSHAKKIAWIHNDINLVFGTGIKAKTKRNINKKMYELYDELVFVSKDNLESFKKVYPSNNIKKTIIYNYIDSKKVITKSKEKVSDIKNDLPSFIVVARLNKQKGLDRLIKVHAKLVNKIPHRIYVVGAGEEKDNLNKLISEYKVNKTFILLGKKNNPYPYIKNGDYFMLPSYFEGYGMVVVEAKILGKPILITNTAAREAINGYKGAIICNNDEQGLLDGMTKMLNNKNKEKYSYNNEELLKDVIKVIGE